MTTKTKIQNVTGDVVRAFLREQSVDVGNRGVLSEAHVKLFNDSHKGSMRYVKGAVKTIDLRVKIKSAKTGNLRSDTKAFPVPVVREAAGKAGTRGPLSKADIEKAAHALSDTKDN